MGIERKRFEMMFRPMPILSVLTLASLVFLTLLGNWQYARYTEKMAQKPLAGMVQNISMVEATIDTANRGQVQQLYGTIDGEPVWRRYAPAYLVDGGDLVMVLVDATGGPQPVARDIAGLDEDYARKANIVLRPVRRGALSASDDADNNIWYAPDALGMVTRLSYSAEAVAFVEPVQVMVRNSADMMQVRVADNPYLMGETIDPLPPERHFGYALTWWGMAIGLLAVYFAFHHSQGRLRFRR